MVEIEQKVLSALGVCKLTKYVRKCVFSIKNYRADKSFTRSPVAPVVININSTFFPFIPFLLFVPFSSSSPASPSKDVRVLGSNEVPRIFKISSLGPTWQVHKKIVIAII